MSQAAAAIQTPTSSEDLEEIIDGLSRAQKTISPKYFYDDAGSKLFDRICELPEYYPTQTELGIMQSNMAEIAELVGPQASLIEFGSGSSFKTRAMLRSLDRLAAYVPVDISGDYLFDIAAELQADFPAVEVLPIAADFMQPFALPTPKIMPLRNIVYFPGSTIGNFSNDAALDLLRVMHHESGEDGALLIGVDLQKDISVLERAYNDSQGVTAEFNLNILRRLNNEFDATFDLHRFRHRAIYSTLHGRIEMYLDSLCDQVISVGGNQFSFDQGESILTEHSHKYTLDGFAAMVETAGFSVKKVWMDERRLFSVQYCVRD